MASRQSGDNQIAQIALPLGEAPHPMSAAAQTTMAFLLRLRARGISDVDVLRAIEMTPREFFAPQSLAHLALRDIALPIEQGQVMPEPLYVARAIEALAVRPGQRVLEIGSGSGYVTAILARLAGAVVSIEYFSELAGACQARLAGLGLTNVTITQGEALSLAPRLGIFDRIIVHGLAPRLANPLIGNLAAGGHMLVGRAGEGGGQLVKIYMPAEGELVETSVGRCRLAPLIQN